MEPLDFTRPGQSRNFGPGVVGRTRRELQTSRSRGDVERFRCEVEGGAGFESGAYPLRIGRRKAQEADVAAGAVDQGKLFVSVYR